MFAKLSGAVLSLAAASAPAAIIPDSGPLDAAPHTGTTLPSAPNSESCPTASAMIGWKFLTLSPGDFSSAFTEATSAKDLAVRIFTSSSLFRGASPEAQQAMRKELTAPGADFIFAVNVPAYYVVRWAPPGVDRQEELRTSLAKCDDHPFASWNNKLFQANPPLVLKTERPIEPERAIRFPAQAGSVTASVARLNVTSPLHFRIENGEARISSPDFEQDLWFTEKGRDVLVPVESGIFDNRPLQLSRSSLRTWMRSQQTNDDLAALVRSSKQVSLLPEDARQAVLDCFVYGSKRPTTATPHGEYEHRLEAELATRAPMREVRSALSLERMAYEARARLNGAMLEAEAFSIGTSLESKGLRVNRNAEPLPKERPTVLLMLAAAGALSALYSGVRSYLEERGVLGSRKVGFEPIRKALPVDKDAPPVSEPEANHST